MIDWSKMSARSRWLALFGSGAGNEPLGLFNHPNAAEWAGKEIVAAVDTYGAPDPPPFPPLDGNPIDVLERLLEDYADAEGLELDRSRLQEWREKLEDGFAPGGLVR